MNANTPKYLLIDVTSAFEELESTISKGYEAYFTINERVKSGNYKDQSNTPSREKLEEWRKISNSWKIQSYQVLMKVYYSTNYANEFMTANHSG